MKKKAPASPPAVPAPTGPFPPTSVRLDPALLRRAETLALANKHAGKPESGISRVLNAALAEYLKKHGA